MPDYFPRQEFQRLGLSEVAVRALEKVANLADTIERLGSAEAAIGQKQPLDALLTSLSDLSDPGGDKMLFWDSSAGRLEWLEPAANLAIDGMNLDAAVASGYEGGPPGTVPTIGSLTWVNQGTSTAADGNGALILTPQRDNNLHLLVQSAPAGDFDVYCRIESIELSPAANTTQIYTAPGLVLRNSGSGALVFFQLTSLRVSGDEQNIYYLEVSRWSGPTAGAGTPISGRHNVTPFKWLRITFNDATDTFAFYASPDGKNWKSVGLETLGAHLGTLNQIGIVGRAASTNGDTSHYFTYFGTIAPG